MCVTVTSANSASVYQFRKNKVRDYAPDSDSDVDSDDDEPDLLLRQVGQ